MGMSKVLDIPLYDDFLNVFTEEDLLGIEVKEAVFNLVAADFSCDLGKVSLIFVVVLSLRSYGRFSL